MSQHEIRCINKNDRYSPQERITHIGGRNSSTDRWKLTLDEAIAGIESEKWGFFVSRGGSRVRVLVATSKTGRNI